MDTDPVLRNPDDVARLLLGPKFKLFLKLPPLRRLMLKALGRHLRALNAALKDAMSEGAEQVVILGAGFDTRVFRFRDLLGGVTVFEVDFPGTQALKQRRARTLLSQQPIAVRYVPVDFNSDNLSDELVKNGFDRSKKTFFIWEGVSMYITPGANDQIFEFVRESSPAGSLMVFEYVFQSLIDGSSTHYGAQEGRAYVAKKGEPFTFGIPEGSVGDFLGKRGFELISDLSGPGLEQQYLSDDSGNIHGKVHAYASVALCRVA